MWERVTYRNDEVVGMRKIDNDEMVIAFASFLAMKNAGADYKIEVTEEDANHGVMQYKVTNTRKNGTTTIYFSREV